MLHATEFLGQSAERHVPTDPLQLSILFQQGILCPILGIERVVLRKSLRAKFPEIHWVFYITPYADRPAFFNADKHAAAHRAVPARGRHPMVRRLFARCVPDDWIVHVAVLFTEDVESEKPFDVHAASWCKPKNDMAMFLGTTLTKKR